MKVNFYIFFFIFFSNINLFSQLFEIQPKNDTLKNDTLFVGDKIVFKNISQTPLSLFYTLDSTQNWIKITDDFNDEYEWQLPFSLSTNIKFKANKRSIIQPELIWEEEFAHTGEIRSASFSEDGKLLITLGSDAKIKIWDILKRKCVDSLELSTNEYVYDARFFHSNDKILFSVQNISYIWNRKNGTYNSFYTIGDFIRKIDIHPNENKFAVISNNNNLALFIETFLLPIPTNLRLYSNSKYANSYSIRYSPNGKKIAIATYNGKIINYDIAANNENEYIFEKSPIFAISFLSDENYIAFGGSSSKMQIYNVKTNELQSLEPYFSSSIKEIKYNIRRNDLLACSYDSTFKIWNYNKFITERKEPYSLLTCDLTSSGDTLLTAGRYNRFRLWKNYQFQNDSQILEFVYRQKLYCSLNFEKTSFNPNEQIKIFSQIHSNYNDTLSKIGKWDISQKIRFPARLLDLFEKEKYEFTDNFNSFIYNTTKAFDFHYEEFDTINCKTLYSTINYDSIFIIKVEVNPKDNFYPILQNKEFQVNYFCGKVFSPQIEFLNDYNFFEILSQSHNYLEIKLIIDNESNNELQIDDLLGKQVYELNLSNLHKGENVVKLNINQLLDGIYFLTLKSGKSVKSKKIYISR
jgi:WD40 repeat protein